MLVNLVKKYGLVPMSVMPNTWNRENSRFVNEILGYKLRENAAKIRAMHASGKSLDEIRSKKGRMMEEIYRIMCIFMGTPPAAFDWSYRDKDNKYFYFADSVNVDWCFGPHGT